MSSPGLNEIATTTLRNRKMATQKMAKQANFTKHAGQPSGHSGFKETQQNNRTVPGKGTNKAPTQGKIKEGNLTKNASQPSGKSIGASVPSNMQPVTGPVVRATNKPLTSAGVFGNVKAAGGADCFRGTSKKGVLRVSGHSGAHMVGKRK
jgi:hypothetical protein